MFTRRSLLSTAKYPITKYSPFDQRSEVTAGPVPPPVNIYYINRAGDEYENRSTENYTPRS